MTPMPRVLLNPSRAIHERQTTLYDRYGGYMTIQNIMKELGVSRNTAKKFAATLPSYSLTGKPVYDIEDVARLIESTRTPPKEATL